MAGTTAVTVAAALNVRFTAGHPSDDLGRAGVIVRQMDSLNSNDDMWGKATIGGGKWDDRLAASLVNARVPHMYSTSAVGLVLAPSAVSGHLWCAYPRDGNSMNQDSHGCANLRGYDMFGPGDVGAMLRKQEQQMHWHKDCLWGDPDDTDRSGCQYNELVLDADSLQARMPDAVEAIFFPTHAPVHHAEGDEQRARAVRQRFKERFGLMIPLLSFDVSEARKGRDPFAPAPGEASTNSLLGGGGGGGADARRFVEMLHGDGRDKFHRMWGETSWRLTAPGAPGTCWGHDPRPFFDSVLAADRCDRNWYEGAHGALGQPTSRPVFPAGSAPALLGFDSSIHAYCEEEAAGRTFDRGGDWNSRLAHTCVAASLNILRLLAGGSPWNMCQNLRWVVCAARGRLPGQRRREMRFATAPGALDFAQYDDPSLGDSWWMEPHDSHFAVSDVYFAEVGILSAICTNAARLFATARGDTFECDFSRDGYLALQQALLDAHHRSLRSD